MDSFQIALDDAAYSHGSDHALGTQWMLPLWEIKAGKFQVADTDHWCPPYCPPINLFFQASMLTQSLIFLPLKTLVFLHNPFKRNLE